MREKGRRKYSRCKELTTNNKLATTLAVLGEKWVPATCRITATQHLHGIACRSNGNQSPLYCYSLGY